MEKDTKTMKTKRVEVSAIITQVDNNPPKISYFTTEGKRLPQTQQVQRENTEQGTKFYIHATEAS